MRMSALARCPADLPLAPSRLLDGLAVGLAILENSPKVRRVHVRRADRLLALGLPNHGLVALEALAETFGKGLPPRRWSAPARRVRQQLDPPEPDWFGRGMSTDACAWAAPDHLTLHQLLAGLEPVPRRCTDQACSALQGLARSERAGLVLPRHMARLEALVDSVRPEDQRQVVDFIVAGMLDARAQQPGVRFHRNCLPGIRRLMDRLVERKLSLDPPAAARPRTRAASARQHGVRLPHVGSHPLPASREPVFDGLPLGWNGRRLAGAGSRHAATPLLHRGEGHLVTIAPTGAGKGVGAVIPALLSHRGSAVVVDPKGENYAVTARFRRQLGQRVRVLDPFGVTGVHSDRLNPMDLLADPDDPTWEDAAMVTGLLVPRHHRIDRNLWWYERGHELLAATFLLACIDPERRERGIEGWLSFFELPAAELRAQGRALLGSPNPDLRMAARSFLAGSDDAFASCVLVAQGLVAELSNPAVACTAAGPSSIDLADFATGVPMTIYLVLPPTQLRAQAALMRLWVGMLLHAALGRRRAPAERTLFLVDEAAQLGPLPPLVTAMTLARGYGVNVWTFWQDLAQMQATYPDLWKTLLHNCAVHQVFGVPNEATAMELAHLHGLDDHRELLSPGRDAMLLMQAGRLSLDARRANYLTDAAFAGCFDPDPLHRGFPHDAAAASNVTPIHARRQKVRHVPEL
ncbi:type IV secretory system conjugative DNA transfer family protein [Pseudoxanthomonas suwonensis]|uniref:type IV secretory system conjugative DNA transfer family protein n=1 Tax=Pseudoxanthomonas suwonensis TaxID=314722 RepID=UPI0012DC88A3|nr:type IV secretory system conjugative DNA transfer family protein [Pseudoxanthomonas suwonensis]